MGDRYGHCARVMPGGGWRLTRPANKTGLGGPRSAVGPRKRSAAGRWL